MLPPPPQEGNCGEKTATESHVDHSDGVLARLFELVGSDTCDVTFIAIAPVHNFPLCKSGSVKSVRPISTAEPANHGDPAMGGGAERKRASATVGGAAREGRSHSRHCWGESSGVLIDGGTASAGHSREGQNRSDDQPSSTPAVRREAMIEAPSSSSVAPTAMAATPAVAATVGRRGEGEEEREKDQERLTPVGPTTASSTPQVLATDRGGGVVDRNNESPPRSNVSTACVSRREFRCHRIMFASCSEYFRALLYGGMSESETRRVELKDVAPELFEVILTYVYTGRMTLTSDNVMDVFALAHRFGMENLLRACAEVLDQCINCEEVCRILEAAEYYGLSELRTKCWDFIKESTPRVLKSESFLDLPSNFLLAMVGDGELQVEEADLFKAVHAWVSKNPSERRHHVNEELAGHFRLPLMSLRELMSVVRPSALLPTDMILDAVTYHADPDEWSGDPLMISPRGRRFKWDSSSLAAGAWTTDNNRSITTSVGYWVGVYGDRPMRSGFHRWSVRANKVGRAEKKSTWGAIVGIAPPHSLNSSRPYLPITGIVTGTGDRKLGGNTAVDDYAAVAVHDGDVVTVTYDADEGVLSFFVNEKSLGEAYSGMPGPMTAALAVNAAGAMWEITG